MKLNKYLFFSKKSLKWFINGICYISNKDYYQLSPIGYELIQQACNYTFDVDSNFYFLYHSLDPKAKVFYLTWDERHLKCVSGLTIEQLQKECPNIEITWAVNRKKFIIKFFDFKDLYKFKKIVKQFMFFNHMDILIHRQFFPDISKRKKCKIKTTKKNLNLLEFHRLLIKQKLVKKVF